MMFQLCKDTSEPCPKKMIKIRNVSSSVVKVTGHGHSVKSGECAFVHEDQQYLQRAISKGLVVVVGESAKEEKTPKKKVRAPKEQVSQEEVAAPQSSDQEVKQDNPKPVEIQAAAQEQQESTIQSETQTTVVEAEAPAVETVQDATVAQESAGIPANEENQVDSNS